VLANRNQVTLIWVPRHCDIPGNGKADEIDRQGAAISLLGPESALENLDVQREKQLKIGPIFNTALNGKIY
jgi:ribonuclease HI